MNRFLCKEIQKRNQAKNIAFNWGLCGTCAYVSRCQDYLEHTQGFNDEQRDLAKEGVASEWRRE